eukprot:TRINITY_DN51792_c0_g1_i1.p1 TRINITY_DN51792_c0_g1~~TRINITY_DN51792_c0_g1_i1.p1  ORF type:complete len:138 (-),score=4.88 TRINITY_DN51792_c0_g1_i1:118-531(-)
MDWFRRPSFKNLSDEEFGTIAGRTLPSWRSAHNELRQCLVAKGGDVSACAMQRDAVIDVVSRGFCRSVRKAVPECHREALVSSDVTEPTRVDLKKCTRLEETHAACVGAYETRMVALASYLDAAAQKASSATSDSRR